MDVDKTEIIEDTDLLDADINTTYFIGIIIECFALLEKVPESIEVSKASLKLKRKNNFKWFIHFDMKKPYFSVRWNSFWRLKNLLYLLLESQLQTEEHLKYLFATVSFELLHAPVNMFS